MKRAIRPFAIASYQIHPEGNGNKDIPFSFFNSLCDKAFGEGNIRVT